MKYRSEIHDKDVACSPVCSSSLEKVFGVFFFVLVVSDLPMDYCLKAGKKTQTTKPKPRFKTEFFDRWKSFPQRGKMYHR